MDAVSPSDLGLGHVLGTATCISPPTAAYSRTPRLTGKITKASHSRRSRGLICGFREWGGWDSNPGPADYESSPPACLLVASDLRRRPRARSCSSLFGHVFGMIKLASCGLLASPLRAAVDLRAVADVEDVDHSAVVVDPVDDAIGTPPGAVTSGQRPKQRFADPVRIFRQGGRTELPRGGGHGLRQLLSDRAPRGSYVLRHHMERVTGIEPALSAWEAERNTPSRGLTCQLT